MTPVDLVTTTNTKMSENEAAQTKSTIERNLG
jgi:hypothetical protein